METKDRIALNFFPLVNQEFSFFVYRRPYNQGDEKNNYPECKRQKLPSGDTKPNGEPIYSDYWTSFDSMNGFDNYSCDLFTNRVLTADYLYWLLKSACLEKLSSEQFEVKDEFYKRIYFILDKYDEGNQTVWLEPYFLKRVGKFGFLADFKFQKNPNIKSSQRTLQLSLSSDKNSRSNRNFYVDRYEKLRYFVSNFFNKIFPLVFDSLKIDVQSKLLVLESESLKTKKYDFGSEDGSEERTDISQFNGLKQHGPLSSIEENIKIYFIYREQDKPFSHDLYYALKGGPGRGTFETFPGMEKMFNYKMNKENIGGIPIDDFKAENLEKAIASIRQDAGERPFVPILITPFSSDGDEEDNKEYHIAKHVFLKHSIPTQFVSLRRIQVKDQLKWAVSNIALQLFAKMGGKPWKLVPKTNDCLIIGLGQSHKRTDDKIEKYFAYSILTESTGIYKDLKILGRETDHEKYMNNFKKNLKDVFDTYYDDYNNFVIHATFKIRTDELQAVEDVLNSVRTTDSKKKFVAMRFNDDNEFFGYSVSNNSMIPYESSFISISSNEFLVWFEGLQYHNPNVRSKIERPMYVKFIYPEESELPREEMMNYLQDAVNLSGANWRGFNAKSLPVSVYYAKLVARYFQEFQTLGLEELDLEKITPWFL